ncbi:GNAT family N-acetyltransferase [Flavobacterium sp.]|jgi:dTDP-4-amino-4,6-dideoxy-D-galactose acyltransferase|uniref:GNAT family N-acetyltransferase n=1 Tax=Flavobacterium sp. TaxID=239 RepID=UPI0037C16DB4
MRIKHLDWDSSFFNKKIGLLELSNDSNFSEIQNDFDLIYVVSDKDIAIEIKDYKQSHSENKIVFSKKIFQKNDSTDANIFLVLEDSIKDEIYELAFESGRFSRFILDPNFGQLEFEKLYKKWVDNSFNKEFADAILVYKEQNKILGFVTYKVWDKQATIGLIGVCSKHQGKGIGKNLIQSVEIELANKGVSELRIPTQLQNEKACFFYTKMGYEIIENKILKHYWKL